ncbi:MAG: 16S rRNA (guanine966-N2)-methyltransferase [Polaribacter sp.]|jgi:16S rRNA (guanine966-N2)-methyltransferase
MRIIGGAFKGRKFTPPAKNWPTRPTTDFAKEGLFNILLNRIDLEDIKMLDLFGGTGNHCYECISRGCTDATYVDKHRACVQFVTKTAQTLQIEDRIKIMQADVFKFLQRSNQQYDYIFADPPFDLPKVEMIPDLIFEKGLLKEDGLFVLEHGPNKGFEKHERYESERSYGKIVFSFFR